MRRIALALALAIVATLLPSPAGAITVYLDYNDHTEPQTPEGPLTLGPFQGTPTDRAEILESLYEDFAPFSIGIYDVPAPARPSRGWIRLVIGGDSGQLGGRNGLTTWECDPAMAPWCDLTPNGNNVVWVAESSAGGTRYSNRWIANTAAHELGHALGLLSADKRWATLENALSHYTVGGPLDQPSHNLLSQGKTEIMNGPSGGNTRDIWWADPDVAKAWNGVSPDDDPANWIWSWQDDILSLASVLGLRRPDHGDTPSHGTGMSKWTGPLNSDETRVVATGVVEMNAASWPGMCPPVPLTESCPFEDEEGNPIPPGSMPGGQGVVFALARDFFRFDVPSIGGSISQQLEIVVETLNARTTGRTVANLDADLEVWFNDPATGWREITNLTANSGGPGGDLWARWVLAFDRGGWYRTGEYAVGVKSAGGYGDLGHYTVHVSGQNLVEVVPVDTGGPRVGHGLRWRGGEGPKVGELAGRLPDLPKLREAMAAMATHGVTEENLARLIDDPESLEPSEEARAHIDKALAQGGAARVLASLIDWEDLDGEEADAVWAEIRDAVAGLEPDREIRSEPQPFEAKWFYSGAETCDSALAVW